MHRPTLTIALALLAAVAAAIAPQLANPSVPRTSTANPWWARQPAITVPATPASAQWIPEVTER
jgi:hypothetical protein